MATINVGPAATNRASVTASGNTVLDLANPAGGTGTITAIDVYVANQTTNTKIGIFYLVSGTTYKCRSSTGDLGVLTTGLKQFTGLSLAVQSGDFIGLWHNGGGIDRADSGGTSAYKAGDYADVGDETSYTTASQTRIISVHGTGTTVNAYTLACDAGSYSQTGSSVTLTHTPASQNLTLACNAGSYTLTGTNADFFAAIKPATDAMLTNQAFGWFGFPVGGFPLVADPVTQNLTITCGAGSYNLTGTDVTLDPTFHYSLICEAGSYTLTGTNADLTVKRMTDYIVANCETAAFNGLYEYDDGTYGLTNPGNIYVWAKWDGNGHTVPDNLVVAIVSEIGRPDMPLIADLYNTYFINGSNTIGSPYLIYPDDPSIVWYFSDRVTPSALTVTAASSGQNLTLTCAAGSYSLTGTDCTLTATVKQNLTLACSAGSYSLTGSIVDLTVQRNYALACSAGNYLITGTATNFEVKRNYVLNLAYPDIIVSGAGTPVEYVNGTYILSGIEEGRPWYLISSYGVIIKWNVSYWAIAIEDGDAFYSTDNVATPDLVTTWLDGGFGAASLPTVTATNSYKLSGTDATLTVQRNYTLVCEPGSYTLTGTDITFGNSKAYSLTCEAGAYTLTGSSVSFVIQRNYSLACETGSYSLTGTDVTLTYTQGAQNFTLACETGSYALTGTNAGLTVQRNYTLECASGSYSLTGSDVTLDPTFHYSLTLESGSYTLTGTDVTLTKTTGAQSYTLVCSAGSYALTGTNTGLTSARTIALASGSYALTGTNASLFKGLVLPCASGTYTLTGSDASLTSHRIFALGMGSYVLVGTSVGLFILSPTPACRTATIEFENRTFAIPHENRTATIEYENRTLEVKCH